MVFRNLKHPKKFVWQKKAGHMISIYIISYIKSRDDRECRPYQRF